MKQILLLAVLVSACKDPVGLGLNPGDYHLVAVDGEPPPALRSTSPQCDLLVPDAAITIEPNDSAYLFIYESLDCTRIGLGVTVSTRFYSGVIAMRDLQPVFVGRDQDLVVTLNAVIDRSANEIEIDDLGDYVSGPGILRLKQ